MSISAKPSLELLRSLTEEHILRALMEQGRLTRADIAGVTGLSKPTISEGMRRLEESGLVWDTGVQPTGRGRGRAGTFYDLSPECGVGLVAGIAPDGVTVEAVDPSGAVVARSVHELDHEPGHEGAAAALAAAAGEVMAAAGRIVRVAVVSAADPVDRRTGRLVHLPDAPFLVGDLDAAAILHPLVAGLGAGRVVVDNDVNWAARAERENFGQEEAEGSGQDRSGSGGIDPDNFVHLHLGAGLGCAIVCDGEVWRGHSGLAGEIAHVVTTGPGSRAMRFTDVFADLGLRRPGSTSIDTSAVNHLLDHLRLHNWPGESGFPGPVVQSQGGGAAEGSTERSAQLIIEAVAGVLAATIAFADPSAALLGGTWGRHPALVAGLNQHFAGSPRPLRVHASTLVDEPELRGARSACLELLRDAIATQAMTP